MRYREDPVRMLRAVRFSAILDFKMNKDVVQPISTMAYLLDQVAPARLLDEFIKLFHNGHSVAVFKLLFKYRLFDRLFPLTGKILQQELHGGPYLKFIEGLLNNTDERVKRGDPVIPAFIMAGFLWLPVVADCRRKAGSHDPENLERASNHVFEKQSHRVALPARLVHIMKKIFFMQEQLKTERHHVSRRLMSERYFRAAYDFMCLRVVAGLEDEVVREHWTEVQAKLVR